VTEPLTQAQQLPALPAQDLPLPLGFQAGLLSPDQAQLLQLFQQIQAGQAAQAALNAAFMVPNTPSTNLPGLPLYAASMAELQQQLQLQQLLAGGQLGGLMGLGASAGMGHLAPQVQQQAVAPGLGFSLFNQPAATLQKAPVQPAQPQHMMLGAQAGLGMAAQSQPQLGGLTSAAQPYSFTAPVQTSQPLQQQTLFTQPHQHTPSWPTYTGFGQGLDIPGAAVAPAPPMPALPLAQTQYAGITSNSFMPSTLFPAQQQQQQQQWPGQSKNEGDDLAELLDLCMK
jgi:hypothetical protein